MKFKKLLAPLLLSAGLLQIPVSASSIPQAYWQYQTPYANAVESNDYNNIISLGLQIESIMVPQPESSTKNNILYTVYDALPEAYQALGDYETAIFYLEKKIPLAKAMGFTDAVILAEKRILQIDPMTEVYAVTQDLSKVPYLGALHEPVSGAYFGRARQESGIPVQDDESMVSFYVECFEEKASQFNYLIGQHAHGDRMIQICLNMPKEADTIQQVLEETAYVEQYFIELFDYLSTFTAPVLLRFGGEMNVWTNLPDATAYKNAFIKVAYFRNTYAKNVALVFSPNSISSWGKEFSEYYPGDQYVDWVGMSAYTQKYYDPSNPWGTTDFNNMFYHTGDYSDPIHALREIVEEFGARKPILISESGSGYGHKTYTNLDLQWFSQSQLKTLFTYANMVFPEIKAIVNFDANIPSDQYKLAMSDNDSLYWTYYHATQDNPSLISSVSQQNTTTYVKAGEYSDSLSTLSLSSFSSPVGNSNMTVTYELNGGVLTSSDEIPYTCNISIDSLGAGTHKLLVKFNGDQGYYKEKYYQLVRGVGNSTQLKEVSQEEFSSSPTPEPEPTPEPAPEPEVQPEIDTSPDLAPETEDATYFDLPASFWGTPYALFALNNGYLFAENGYFSPDSPANRGTTAVAFANFSGESQENLSVSFEDTVSDFYYEGIAWCATNGVMGGYDSQTFGTEDPLTREQFAVTMSAYAKYLGVYTAPDSIDFSGFEDEDEISSWAKDSLAWAVDQKLMTGTSSTTISPKTSVTRVQVAVMLYALNQQFDL